MKKVILKTAFITLGATIVVLVAVFGLMSLWAPAVMMDLTASLGLDAISGDYAYQEYERSENIEYLARSFIISAHTGNDRKAVKRFELLYGNEKFDSFCEEQEPIKITESTSLSYRSYVCAQGVCVKYRTCSSQSEWAGICQFAIDETDPSFPVGNPVAVLANEARSNEDKEFCKQLLGSFADEQKFAGAGDYDYVMKFLNDLVSGISGT
ncbi:MAG: hypothetical protein K2G44_01290 [Clostridia bacterium]|nr:hypothetical protein [Clostridia bacterium]MDE6676592.1 hypothetical protein [Clostridia bacterium]